MIKILSSDTKFIEAVEKQLASLNISIEEKYPDLTSLIPSLERYLPEMLLVNQQDWLAHKAEFQVIFANHPYLQTIILGDNISPRSDPQPATYSSLKKLPAIAEFAIMQLKTLTMAAQGEAYYRSIFNKNTDPIVSVSLDDGLILDANQVAEKFFGYSRNELLSSNILSLVNSPSLWERLRQSVRQNPNQSSSLIIELVLKNSTTCIVDVTASHINWAGNDAAIYIFQDITQIVQERESLEHQRADLMKQSAEKLEIELHAQDDLTHAEESLRLLTILAQIEIAINQSLELDASLDKMNKIVTQALSLTLGACILLPEVENETFVLHSSNIPELQTVIPYKLAQEDSQAIEYILQNKGILVVEDVSFSPYEKSPFIRDFGVGSGCGLPLLVEEEIIGILFVLDKQPRQYSEDEIHFLTALANRIGMAITKVQLYQSLQNAKEAAEYAARNRAEYLASMSHELRAPLAAINNLSDLMSATHLTHQQADYLVSIKSSTDHLLALLNDILDFSRLEASRLELKNKEFTLIQVIESALTLVAIPAAQKNLDLAYIIDDDVPETLIGDPNRLRQVFTNLLTNAIKFTENGQITVEAHRQAKHLSMVAMIDSELELLFTIRDTGIGIAKEAQKNLFKPFSQVDDPDLHVNPGSGLGLSICKQIVQLMGGDIWVKSSGVNGEGSSFSFTIQTRIIYAQPSPYLQQNPKHLMGKRIAVIGTSSLSLNRLLHWLEHWGIIVSHFELVDELLYVDTTSNRFDLVVIDDRCILPNSEDQLVRIVTEWKLKRFLPVIIFMTPNTQRREKLKTITTNTLHWPMSLPRFFRSLSDSIEFSNAETRPQILDPTVEILLVDDDIVNLAAVQLHLNRMGYKADTVPNGYEALNILANKRYDLVIMDMRMGAMDGHETTRTIRESFPNDAQPIIAILTAGVSPNQLNALQSAGMDAYIEKPINADQLINLIELVHHQQAGDLPQSIPVPTKSILDDQSDTTQRSIDPSVLRNLLNISPSDNRFDEVGFLELFDKTAPDLLQEANNAVSENLVDNLRDALHALRGTCEIYGAHKFSELCRRLELEIDQTMPENIQDRMDEISTEFENVQSEIQFFIAEPQRLFNLTK